MKTPPWPDKLFTSYRESQGFFYTFFLHLKRKIFAVSKLSGGYLHACKFSNLQHFWEYLGISVGEWGQCIHYIIILSYVWNTFSLCRQRNIFIYWTRAQIGAIVRELRKWPSARGIITVDRPVFTNGLFGRRLAIVREGNEFG